MLRIQLESAGSFLVAEFPLFFLISASECRTSRLISNSKHVPPTYRPMFRWQLLKDFFSFLSLSLSHLLCIMQGHWEKFSLSLSLKATKLISASAYIDEKRKVNSGPSSRDGGRATYLLMMIETPRPIIRSFVCFIDVDQKVKWLRMTHFSYSRNCVARSCLVILPDCGDKSSE